MQIEQAPFTMTTYFTMRSVREGRDVEEVRDVVEVNDVAERSVTPDSSERLVTLERSGD